MPELPEVEVVRRGLEAIVNHQPILEKIELTRADLRDPMPAKKLRSFVGQKILKIERRAKYLLFWMEKGAMLSHLGMTGTWRVAPIGEERDHDHIYLYFSGGLRLAYRDPRRFGIFDYLLDSATHPRLQHLGPEPFDPELTAKILWQSLRGKKTSIKVAVMDQKVLVGVGNIYASEALFAAKIKPTLAAEKVSLARLEIFLLEVRRILQDSISKGGSSISDFAQASGESGYFQNTFLVYDRDQQECKVCGKKIRAQILGGRNTFWCGHCQK